MSFFGRLLGYLSLIVNLLLSLALLGVGLIASFETSDLKLDPIPAWSGTVTSTVLCAGLLGLVAVVLAFRPSKAARSLHVLWSLVVLYIGSRAFWSSAYRFDGIEDFKVSLWIFAGYLLVLLGSLLHFKSAGSKRRGYRRN
ncbi:MAG: hypothetical protein O3A53_05805 [Acidobacteria bacterium]|nr:hypothetical protein [Acidobacteriota bacterium]MDA1234295.1 hypothetical protein [Acidobacteriota bacterium]